PVTKAFTFSNPNFEHLHRNMGVAAQRGLPVFQRDALKGLKGVCLVAPGPTMGLGNHQWVDLRNRAREGFQVWAIKEAILLCEQRGVDVHASVQMDPDSSQAGKTPARRKIHYYLASTCDPLLYDHILLAGAKVTVFHSATGWSGSGPHPTNPQQ